MNVLILTAKYGMGHYTTSMSLKQELDNENTNTEVIDFLDVLFPHTKEIYYNTFNFLVSKCSGIYNFLYKFSANVNNVPFKHVMKKRIDKIIKGKNIDIVISTFPLCSKYISAYKKLNNYNFKIYTYITDIEVNREWLTPETDMYFVASNESKKQIINQDIPEEKVKIVGIPVRKEFKEKSCSKVKNEIVIMGGGLGLLPYMDKTLEDLSQNKNIHITLFAGANQKLLRKYNNRYNNITVMGYTDEVYKYMEKAEIIITKAGGITLFEAINTKTPIYVLHPFLSQEIGNAKFIEENRIGKVIWTKNESTAEDILQLLNTPSKLESMRKNMEQITENLEKATVVDVYRGEKVKC